MVMHAKHLNNLLSFTLVKQSYKRAFKENKITTWSCRSAKKTLEQDAEHNQVLVLLLPSLGKPTSYQGQPPHRNRGQTTWRAMVGER
jgi:hypothetical protein